jgi:hypothetical protein
MVEQAALLARPLLNLPAVRRTRRNHALEHATITILATRLRNLRMAGRSDAGGFVLIGDAPTESIEQAAEDALHRLNRGEHRLAIHPNCGTNLVTSALMTSLAAMLGLLGAERRDWFGRLPLVMLLVMLGGILALPLGNSLQKHVTTDSDPGDTEIIEVTRQELRLPFGGTVTMHRVYTRSS